MAEDPKAVIMSDVEGRLEMALDAKADRMEEATTILLSYAGFGIDRSRQFATGATKNESLPHWFDDKVVVNAMQPIARTAAAMISSNNPSWVVEPMGDSASKYQAARGVQKLLEYLYRSNNLGSLIDDVALRATLLGYAGLYVDWDDQIGTGEITDSQFGRQGWYVIEPVDLFNLHFEPGVGGLENAFWCMREATMHIEAARLFFNTNEIQPERDRNDENSTVRRHLKLVSEPEMNNSGSEDETDRVRILHYWQKPGFQHPNGLEVVVAGDSVVQVEDRLIGGEFPVYMMRYMLEPHRDYGCGLGSVLLQLQRDMSMTWNGYRARRDQEIMPPWFVPVGSTVRNINTRPNAINEINPRAGGSPQPIRFDSLSQVVGSMGDRTLAMMEYASGINDASRGEAPTSNATGRMTAFLAELDNRRMGPTIRSMASLLSSVAKRMIRLWQEYGSESITVTVLGSGHAAEVSEIRRQDLLWQDIDVDVASLMPRTQPLRQETVLNLLQMGAINPEEARGALEFGGFSEAMGVRSMEALNARANLERLGDIATPLEDVVVSPHDDHATYVREYKKHLSLEQPGVHIRERIEQQISLHMQFLQPPPQEGGVKGAPGAPVIAGATAAPGGLPPDLVSLQEPGVDKAEEAALASMAGIPS